MLPAQAATLCGYRSPASLSSTSRLHFSLIPMYPSHCLLGTVIFSSAGASRMRGFGVATGTKGHRQPMVDGRHKKAAFGERLPCPLPHIYCLPLICLLGLHAPQLMLPQTSPAPPNPLRPILCIPAGGDSQVARLLCYSTQRSEGRTEDAICRVAPFTCPYPPPLLIPRLMSSPP